MKKYLVIALMLLSTAIFAQNHQVKGTVSDQDGKPLAGFTVFEKGTSNGTTTGPNGTYQLTVSSENAILEFVCLGYTTISEEIRSRSLINITAQEDAIDL